MSGSVWEVVGGKDSGGITVRTGRDLKSPEAEGGRLSHGALVAELALEGERLRFTRLSGTGPNDGWVSLSFKSKALVARAGEAGTQAAAEATIIRESKAALERGERMKPKPGCYKLWILTQGSRGDVQPMLALAVGARKAGWAVRLLAGEDHKDFVEAQGIEFIEAGPSLHDARSEKHAEMTKEELQKEFLENQKELGNEIVSNIFNQDACMVTAQQVMEELDKAKEADDLPDAMFYHPLAGAGPFLFWAKYNFPIFWVDYVAAPLSPDEHMVEYMKQVSERDGPELKKRFGLDPFEGWDQKALLEWKKDRTISCASRLQVRTNDFLVEHCPKELLDHLETRFTGPLILDSAAQMIDLGCFGGQEMLRRAQDFLDAGERPIYVGWGSMPMDAPVLTKVLINAKFVKLRVVFVKGWSKITSEQVVDFVKEFMPDDPFGILEYMRTSVLFLDVASHEWLMPRCCLTLHHGGAGTTQVALRAGVPTIVTPFGMDQFQWAEFVIKLGCGQQLSLIENTDKMMDPAWTKALRKASSDAAMVAKAKEVGESIRGERGVAAVLDRIRDGIEMKARGETAGLFGC